MSPMSAVVAQAVGAEVQHELHRAAGRDRLAALARCCQPATWRQALRRVRAFAAR